MTLDEKLDLYEKQCLTESANEEFVKDFSYKIIGIIRTEPNGDIIALNFPGRQILGMYIKSEDHTITFPARKIIGKGNQIAKFIYVK